MSAEELATGLRKAMKGLGTDEKAIIKILNSIDNAKRQEVKQQFKTMYGRDLIDDLKSELGGNMEEVTVQFMMSKTEHMAYGLRSAMKGAGTDETALVEILATSTNAEINDAKAAYKEMYGRDLEKDVMSETGGHLKRILVSIVQGNRDESEDVDEGKAEADAQALKDAGEGSWGTDESEFNRVFMTSSRAQLRAMMEAYRRISDYDLRRIVEKEMSGDLEFAFVTLVEAARDVPGYFAERAYRAMKGAGTDDDTLIRVVVGRAEKDLEEVKAKFLDKYSKHLGTMIKGDCNGDYKRMLLAICGED
jgi:annexin A7/11